MPWLGIAPVQRSAPGVLIGPKHFQRQSIRKRQPSEHRSLSRYPPAVYIVSICPVHGDAIRELSLRPSFLVPSACSRPGAVSAALHERPYQPRVPAHGSTQGTSCFQHRSQSICCAAELSRSTGVRCDPTNCSGCQDGLAQFGPIVSSRPAGRDPIARPGLDPANHDTYGADAPPRSTYMT